MYNFNHLYYFYITAKFGGVGQAAKHLRISQPSLSSQLKVLERALDVRLFTRVGRNNQITLTGSVIFGLCRQMFEISETMGELIAKDVPTVSRRIHIGVSDEIDRPFVVEVISLFLKKHGLAQRPRVSVISGKHEELVEKLRFREIDAVVTASTMIDPELESLRQAEVPVGLVCSSRWKMRSSQRKLKAVDAIRDIVDGENAHWVMPSSRFKLTAEINQFFDVNELKGRIVFESDVIASLVRSVIDEVGLAFLPLLYVAREIREKSVRVIGPKEGYWKYRVFLTCHSQSKNDSLIKALADSFVTICKQASG